MPNWCENNLSIMGRQEDMDKFMKVITIRKDEYSLLETLYPTPEDLNIGDVPFVPNEEMKANGQKHGFHSWYDWRIANWGCKWPESELNIGQQLTYNSDGTSIIAFNFETPWGPPIEAFNKISQDYPNLLFCLYYEEPGMAFCGKNVWADGEEKESEQAELIGRWFDEDYLFDEYIRNNTIAIAENNN